MPGFGERATWEATAQQPLCPSHLTFQNPPAGEARWGLRGWRSLGGAQNSGESGEGGRAREVIWSIHMLLRSGVYTPNARERLTCLVPPCLPFAEVGKCFPTSNPRCPLRPTAPQRPALPRRSAPGYPQPFEVAPAANRSRSWLSPGTREGEAEREPGSGRACARVGSRRPSRTRSA